MGDKLSTSDQIAINGALRAEGADDGTVQFWSEYDGWVANVGHNVAGDGLTLAEAQRMADLWNADIANREAPDAP